MTVLTLATALTFWPLHRVEAAIPIVSETPQDIKIVKLEQPKIKKLNYEADVLAPLKEAQRKDAEARELARLEAERIENERIQAEQAELARLEAIRATQMAQAVVYTNPAPERVIQPQNSSGGLTGSYGHATPYGNCVQEPGVNNPGSGNPISWAVTSSSPWIGATALFTYNHTGVITGIWSNGDLESAHKNVTGGQTRFPISQFRGFR